MDWTQIPWIAIDTETTGLDLDTTKVYELGIARREPNGTVTARSVWINPVIPIPAELIKKFRISPAAQRLIYSAPPFVLALIQLQATLAPCIAGQALLLTYNGDRYDLPLLQREAARIGGALALPEVAIDGLALVRAARPNLQRKGLGHAARALEITVDVEHRADADCKTTIAVVEKLMPELPHELDLLQRVSRETGERWESDYKRFGYFLRSSFDRRAGKERLWINFGQLVGTPLDRAPRWWVDNTLVSPKLTPEGKEALLRLRRT